MKEIVFILVGSRKRVGKDTVSNMLLKKLNDGGRVAYTTAFATSLKQEVQVMLRAVGVFIDAFTEDPKLKESVVRPILIAWGMARRAMDPDYWIDKVADRAVCIDEPLVQTRAMQLDPHRFVIVSDWRFPNELTVLRDRGFIVRGIDIRRDDIPNVIPEEIENSPKCAALATTTIPNLHDLSTLDRVCDGVVAELNRIYPNTVA